MSSKERSGQASRSSSDEEASQPANHPTPTIKGEINGLDFTILLDPCSAGAEGYIVNYIHPNTVQQIQEHEKKFKKKLLHTCACVRATTCTAAGCFETSTCKTLYIRLYDETNSLNEEKIAFRIAKGIHRHMIIGNHTFRELDLSKAFRHLFKPKEDEKGIMIN